MVCQNLHQTHLQKVGQTQIHANHIRVKGLTQLAWSLNESQWPSQLCGHNLLFLREVTLRVLKVSLATWFRYKLGIPMRQRLKARVVLG